MEENPKILRSIQHLISTDELEEAIKLLNDLCENSPLLNELLHQSGRLRDLNNKIRTGTVESEKAFVIKNQIRVGLLEVIEEIKLSSANKKVTKELRAFDENHSSSVNISDSGASTVYGNVNIGGEIAAGRDIQIGNKKTKGNKPFWKFW